MSFSHFTTWLFDLDGTLVNSVPAVIACVKKTVTDMGHTYGPDEEIRGTFGRGLWNTLGLWVPTEKVDEAVHRYLKNFPDVVRKNLQLFPGARELLNLLEHKKIPMAVVTGNMEAEAQGIFEQLNIGQYFPVVICADTIPFQKPSPEPVTEALKRLGRPVDGAVFIGDSEHDIRAGRLAGVKTIGIRGGSSKEEKLLAAKPDYVVESILEILNRIEFTY